MSEVDLIYVGFLWDIPIFIDKTLQVQDTAYILDLSKFWMNGIAYDLFKGKVILIGRSDSINKLGGMKDELVKEFV